jgi:hypothetical protein
MDLVAVSPCSAYDCEYVALADTLAVPLLIYDAEFSMPFRIRRGRRVRT